jgi:xanthosine utilization system XapX-like protein
MHMAVNHQNSYHLLNLRMALRSRATRGIAMWLRLGSGLLMVGMLWGCATVNGPAPPASVPVFQADESDTVVLQAVQQEQEALLGTCAQFQSCDRVHFTRAMIALFQNGEAAAASFQEVMTVAPKGPFADSSARWIRFLANRTVHSSSADESNGAAAVMKGLVRTWFEQQHVANTSASIRAGESAKSQDRVVPTLRREIRTRDKRIAELTEQLSTLKQIDLEAHRPNKLSLPKTLSK